MHESIVERSELPLEMDLKLSASDAWGTFAETTWTRGLVSQTLISAERGKGQSAKTKLLLFAKLLRERLEIDGIPSDRVYVWIREEEGPWQPDPDPDVEKKKPYDLCWWHEHMRRVTEPVSVHRIRGELLHAINEVLQDLTLETVCHLLSVYRNFVLAEVGNPLLLKARREQERRDLGPRTKKNQSPIKLQIVCRHAEKIWRQKAALRGDRSNTAAEILHAVNEDFLAHKFKKVSQKTVASYIRDGIRGELFATG